MRLGLQEFAGRLQGVRKGADGWHYACCPAHDDRHASLSFRTDARGIQVKCHAGCTRKEILAAMHLTEGDVFEPDDDRSRRARIEATYPYRDAAGNLLYETVRLFPKGFYQRRPATPKDPPDRVTRDEDGHQWVNSLKGPDGKPIARVLYRLPEVVDAVAAGRTVFVPEGEKDVETLVHLGVDATTSPQGAGKWNDSFAVPLAGATRIIVCPDNDPPPGGGKDKGFPGQRHAAVVVRSLFGAGVQADRVRVLEFPGCKDVSDWVAAGGTPDELQRLADAAPDGAAWLRTWEGRLGGAAAGGTEDVAALDVRNTDKGNADRLVAVHGDDLMFDGEDWYVWDGRRYVRDVRSRRMEMAKAVAEANLRDALAIKDDEDRDAAMRAARRGLQIQRLQAMVDLAASDPRIRVEPDDLDADVDLLNVSNGTIDLRTGALRAHDRADRITKLSPVEYDPSAACPRFLAFLDFVMAGNPTLVAYLQRFAGSCLSGDARDQLFHVWYGGGSNGKGTLIRILMRVMGGYACQANTETFLEHASEPSGASHQEDLARLKGIRFVAAEEASPGRKLNLGRIKQMTGGDRIVARKPWGRQSIEYTPQFTLVFATNHAPSVPSADYGTWRRLRQCPFNATISPEMRDADPEFESKLAAEDAGVLRWAVEGCMAWRRDGIRPPEEVMESTKQWRVDTNPVVRFLTEKCVTGPGRQCKASDLYAAYQGWCQANDEEPLKQRSFGTRLTELQIGRGRGTDGVHVRLGIDMRGPNDRMTEDDRTNLLFLHTCAPAGTQEEHPGEIGHEGSFGHSDDTGAVEVGGTSSTETDPRFEDLVGCDDEALLEALEGRAGGAA